MDEFPIAEDPTSEKMLEISRKAARTNATVLIYGETGVGKELLAHYIHRNSAYHQGPFISVNCAALPANMIEAIFFGYEKGAFTGAVHPYEGKFEQAQDGTLLLDEVSEIPLELQAKLLRVLQEREIERLGGKNLLKLNVRIIAATNVNLNRRVSEGTFRQDLYYRLNVFPIYCASLRDRKSDIIPLIDYFIKKYSTSFEISPPCLTKSAYEKLKSYVWPGNVREMENLIQRTLIMSDKAMLDADNFVLPDDVSSGQSSNFSEHSDILLASKLKENEAMTILSVLKETDGCRDIAAKKLKISPRTLRYKISKLKSIGFEVP